MMDGVSGLDGTKIDICGLDKPDMGRLGQGSGPLVWFPLLHPPSSCQVVLRRLCTPWSPTCLARFCLSRLSWRGFADDSLSGVEPRWLQPSNGLRGCALCPSSTGCIRAVQSSIFLQANTWRKNAKHFVCICIRINVHNAASMNK